MECGVPRESARRILKKHHYKSYKYNLHQHLYDNDSDRRLQFCNWYLAQAVNGNLKILFSDESRFTNNGLFNRNNTRYWSRENLHLLRVGNHQERFGVNVWLGIVGDRLIGPIFFQGPLTGQRYLEYLRTNIEESIEDLPLTYLQNFYLQQDGAPPHNARIVTDYLDNRYENRWIGTNGPIRWPPRSPDITPLDFFVWPFLKEKVFSAGAPQNLNILIQKIRVSLLLITPEMMRNVQQSLYRRINMCVHHRGGNFEQFL